MKVDYLQRYEGDQAGFTLVEMLVVLAIVGLVVSIGLPLLKGPPDRLRLSATARDLQRALQMARAMAVSSNDEQALTIDTDLGTIDSTAPVSNRSLGEIRTNLIVANVERKSESVGGFRFFPDGSSTGGSITLRLRHLQTKISVDWRTGRVSLDEIPNGA